MREIRGDAKNIRGLLSGAKYSIDYYQREYKWDTKQVSELLDDLTSEFLEDYEEGHDPTQVETYGHYFLGSIIISDKDGRKFVIDGQQRLTTLTLLLIFLHNLQKDRDDKVEISELIFSTKYSRKSFNLDIPERTACMEALFTGTLFDETRQPESVQNMMARYRDIEDLFPVELRATALSYFVDWLIENVHLVEITAYSDEDAYMIFETMNDRGLSLAPTDMLKGYLLANIGDNQKKLAANEAWKRRIAELRDIGKDEDADFLKAWLRSQYANSIRERKRGAKPQDFDRIGTEFHRWVKDNDEAIGLHQSSDFAAFIERDFAFYASWYSRLRNASSALTPGLESVFYNAQQNFTLQYVLLLAPLLFSDPEPQILRKVRVTAAFIDILVARRIWNWRAIDYSTMQYAMFLVMRDIRGKKPHELVDIFRTRLADEEETFATNERFRLHGMNGRQIHHILARMTDYVETSSGMSSHFTEYLVRSGKHGYEVEHIWADHPERYEDEFPNPADFEEYRNRIGGLILLPKKINASFGDLPYEDKRKHYIKENLLARSLHECCYERNPGFVRFVRESGLQFQYYPHFRRTDFDARQALYQSLAEVIWNPDRLEKEANA
jgi:uncharacterized protein with ParB-like and HNH nuclease domain